MREHELYACPPGALLRIDDETTALVVGPATSMAIEIELHAPRFDKEDEIRWRLKMLKSLGWGFPRHPIFVLAVTELPPPPPPV